jgi:hypothetical protein
MLVPVAFVSDRDRWNQDETRMSGNLWSPVRLASELMVYRIETTAHARREKPSRRDIDKQFNT